MLNRTPQSSIPTNGISRSIIKIMGLFSGIQIINILCSIIKMKLVAIWLHASGVGLFSIYSSTIETIATFSNLGLRQSTVPDISRSKNSPKVLNRIITIVRKWSKVAGLIGAVAISGGAPFLAKSFFGDWTMCWGFIALSASMLMNSLLDGEQAILQGTGMLKSLAKGSLWGTCSGLLLSIPMFYFMREDSVVPSIIVYSAATLLFTLIFRYKVKPTQHSKVNNSQIWHEGKGFVKLGICMAIATFITNVSHLIFLAYLNSKASTSEVGLYHAGSTLIIRYVGLIFTAVGMEFFPRLSANHTSSHRTKIFVSHEISILLLIITPVILLFLLCREWVVELLYSESFLTIVPFISWAVMSSIFKAVSWCMAFTILAKGDGKKYIFTEGIDAIVGLTLNVVLYDYFGLVGIGIAYILWYMFYCLIVGVVYYRCYNLRLHLATFKTIFLSIITCIAALASMEYIPYYINIFLLISLSSSYIFKLKKLYFSKR